MMIIPNIFFVYVQKYNIFELYKFLIKKKNRTNIVIGPI